MQPGEQVCVNSCETRPVAAGGPWRPVTWKASMCRTWKLYIAYNNYIRARPMHWYFDLEASGHKTSKCNEPCTPPGRTVIQDRVCGVPGS